MRLTHTDDARAGRLPDERRDRQGEHRDELRRRVWIAYLCAFPEDKDFIRHRRSARSARDLGPNDGENYGDWHDVVVARTAGITAKAMPAPVVKQHPYNSEGVYVMYEDAKDSQRVLMFAASTNGGNSFQAPVSVLQQPTLD